MQADEDRKKNRYRFDRHTPEYRGQFETITAEMLSKCPIACSETYDGHFVAAGHVDETIEILQQACDEQRLAEPVTVRKSAAKLGE